MLTGERFDATEACRIGLVHQIAPAEALDQTVETVVQELLGAGPKAVQAAKSLVHDIGERPISPDVIELTATRIAALRAHAGSQGRPGRLSRKAKAKLAQLSFGLCRHPDTAAFRVSKKVFNYTFG